MTIISGILIIIGIFFVALILFMIGNIFVTNYYIRKAEKLFKDKSTFHDLFEEFKKDGRK